MNFNHATDHGSSPPVRGTPCTRTAPYTPVRFIPARAGNTISGPAKRLGEPVHPRPCGEHEKRVVVRCRCRGSSPPVRGTPGPSLHRRDGDRFIPARAGNTMPRPVPGCRRAVHPRPCGEHRGVCARDESGDGSSPPVRGTLHRTVDGQHGHRFIPARAGNTPLGTTLTGLSTVHPRPCGEHMILEHPILALSGSSPPVRGTRDYLYRQRGFDRFIPARAGNTPILEHTILNPVAGSSPPVRGTRTDYRIPSTRI